MVSFAPANWRSSYYKACMHTAHQFSSRDTCTYLFDSRNGCSIYLVMAHTCSAMGCVKSGAVAKAYNHVASIQLQ